MERVYQLTMCKTDRFDPVMQALDSQGFELVSVVCIAPNANIAEAVLGLVLVRRTNPA